MSISFVLTSAKKKNSTLPTAPQDLKIAVLRQRKVNAAIFHSFTVERFTRSVLLRTMKGLGVQLRPIMIRISNGETAH